MRDIKSQLSGLPERCRRQSLVADASGLSFSGSRWENPFDRHMSFCRPVMPYEEDPTSRIDT